MEEDNSIILRKVKKDWISWAKMEMRKIAPIGCRSTNLTVFELVAVVITRG